MLIVWDLGILNPILVISLILPLIALFLRRKWKLATLRKEEINQLLIHASEEASRVELEFSYVSSNSSLQFHCPVCYALATTRCSRCKSVRYCSGKCQIIHWRQGHKDECRPASIVFSNDHDIVDNGKDDIIIIDKEEEAETSGSSFSGFSLSPRNDSGDEISLCESFSSSDDSPYVSVESVEKCDDDVPLSPKFVHLVESVDNVVNLSKLSLSNNKSGGDDAGIESLVTDKVKGSSDLSLLKSSDFWGTALGSVERLNESCDVPNSSVHFSSSRDRRNSSFEEASRSALGSGNDSNEDEAEVSLPTSPPTASVALQKAKSISESGSMLASLKVRQDQNLAFKASNTRDRTDANSPLVAKVEKVLDHQKQNGVDVHRVNSLPVRNGLKASLVKRTRPMSSAESETEGRNGHKEGGLFPYELFAKLYTKKISFQPCGLINCGNTCFANVVFQCLMFTPPLTTYFFQQLHSKTCQNKEQCFTCGFQNLVLKAKEGKSPLSPHGLLSQLQNSGIRLGNGKQEDAHEFLRFVVDKMQSVSEYDKPKTKKLEDTTLIGLTFGGYLRSKIKCMKCREKSELHEKMMDLTVEIDGDINTLEDALLRFTKTEILDGENKYKCGRCKSYEKAKKKLKIIKPPNVLTIALKRFQSGKFGKLNKFVRYPETLNLSPYVSSGSEKSHDYKLYGVIVHLDTMNSTSSGHYVCYVSDSQNKWYKADDSSVVTCDIESVLTKGAYMLFYARCSPMPPPRLVVCNKTEASEKKSKTTVVSRSVSTPSHVLSSSTRPGNIQSFYSSFQRLQRILEDDSASDSSSLFDSNSDECSCSTDSTSMDDFADFIFGQSEAPSPISSCSSLSPLSTRHSPLGDLRGTCRTSTHHLPLASQCSRTK